jgi:DNA-binding FadR family transcriptional regulator
VVAAIMAGDPAGAHGAMIHHMTLVENAFEEFAGFGGGV